MKTGKFKIYVLEIWWIYSVSQNFVWIHAAVSRKTDLTVERTTDVLQTIDVGTTIYLCANTSRAKRYESPGLDAHIGVKAVFSKNIKSPQIKSGNQ